MKKLISILKNLTLKSKIDPEKEKNLVKILRLEQVVIKEDELAEYDGLGNYQNYKDVRNSYKIVWENISKDSSTPYWFITSIKSYNSKGKEFFNIY